jgi:hypothetical protein
LTVLSSRADALVVTGSSNVGRLMMLLFEARRREVGEAEGRREVRSLDTRCARLSPHAYFRLVDEKGLGS